MHDVPGARNAMTNGHCSLQLGVERALMGVQGAKPMKLSRYYSLHLPKIPKIHPRGPFTLNYNFMNFVD